ASKGMQQRDDTPTELKERRVSARIDVPYTVRVRGTDIENCRFKEHALLENLSEGGLYARLRRKLVEGADVSLVVRLSSVPAEEISVVHLAARGAVLRVDPQPDGRHGMP